MTDFRRILVPLDGSELSEAAIPMAITLARKFDSELVLLRVLEFPVPLGVAAYPEDHWMQEALQFGRREAQVYLEQQEATLTAKGLLARSIVLDESPAEDILFVAANEDIDLIIMTSHGVGGSARWPSGSVALKVMQYSPCPVLIVRQKPEEND